MAAIQLVGNFAEAERLFNNLNWRKQKNIIRAATRSTLKPVLTAAQSNYKSLVRKITGRGYKSLGYLNYRTNIGGAVGARIKTGKYFGYYAKFLNAGTVVRHKKNGAVTGKITANRFFDSAVATTQPVIMANLQTTVINTINNYINSGRI